MKPHFIRKYNNRKLYSMKESRYITLSEVLKMVAEGEEIVVTNNKTLENITTDTLKAGLSQLNLDMETIKSLIRKVY